MKLATLGHTNPFRVTLSQPEGRYSHSTPHISPRTHARNERSVRSFGPRREHACDLAIRSSARTSEQHESARWRENVAARLARTWARTCERPCTGGNCQNSSLAWCTPQARCSARVALISACQALFTLSRTRFCAPAAGARQRREKRRSTGHPDAIRRRGVRDIRGRNWRHSRKRAVSGPQPHRDHRDASLGR